MIRSFALRFLPFRITLLDTLYHARWGNSGLTSRITAYLVLDASHVEEPRPLDDEEDIEIVKGVSIAEILIMIKKGEFNLVGGFASLLAIEKLRDLGEYP